MSMQPHVAGLIAGARYVEAAIMAPITSRRIASPILMDGPHAAAFLSLAHSARVLRSEDAGHGYVISRSLIHGRRRAEETHEGADGA